MAFLHKIKVGSKFECKQCRVEALMFGSDSSMSTLELVECPSCGAKVREDDAVRMHNALIMRHGRDLAQRHARDLIQKAGLKGEVQKRAPSKHWDVDWPFRLVVK